MKKGQLFILLVLCVVVGSLGWFVKKSSRQSWEQQDSAIGELLFPEFPLNDITKLLITSKENSVELVKDSDAWVVKTAHSYYADFSKIADLLKDVADLKILQKIEIGPDDLGRLELNEPDKESETGTRVEFFSNKGSSLGKILLGKQHMRKASGNAGQFGGGGEWPDGRYILQPTTTIVALVSETFSSVVTDSDSWLDKTFIKIEKIKKATTKEGGNIIWSIHRENEGSPLVLSGDIDEGYEVDTSKLNAIDSSLRYANFNTIASSESPEEELGFAEGRTYVAETFDGFTYTIDIGKKGDDDNYPIKVLIQYAEPEAPASSEDETEEQKAKKEEEFREKIAQNREKFETESKRYSDWVYMVSSYTVDNLLLDRSELIKKKEEKTDDGKADTTSTNDETGENLENDDNLTNKSDDESDAAASDSLPVELDDVDEMKTPVGTPVTEVADEAPIVNETNDQQADLPSPNEANVTAPVDQKGSQND